jgi:SAM-dependent methyltransferase
MATAEHTRADIRQIYEDHPYPGPQGGTPPWQLAPMEWIQALWGPGRAAADPERILVAGCGTGAEAFALRRRFPDAAIVAIDFSSRSIAMANQLQRRSRRRPVRFMVADLSVRGLHRMVGRDFDFVSCHGVLTYVPAPTRALRSLARCLAPDGALYLGVNGSRHRSIPLRDALPAFGFDAARLVDTPALREVLRLLNALLPPFDRMVRETAPYLASDVFGPLFQNLPLAAWIGVGREAGLHFQGSFSSHRDLRPVFEQGLGGRLAPRSRAEICELLDIMQPAAFHRLLFTRTRASNPPWARYDRLVTWRPVLTNLYRSRLPARSGSGRRER